MMYEVVCKHNRFEFVVARTMSKQAANSAAKMFGGYIREVAV